MSYIKKSVGLVGLNICKGDKMEENNGLQDILLDKNDDEKSGKIRKILIGIAALVILFVVILIIMKLLNGSSNNTSEVTNDPNLVLPSEPQLKVESQTTTNNEIFEQVPIASDTSKENFESIVNDYKNNQLGNNNETAPIETNLPEPQVKETPKTDSISKPKAEQAKKTETKKATPKQEATKNVSKEKKSVSKSVPAGKYIQVASISKFSPNNPLIKKIESNGLNYHIYETTVNGKNTIKVLIGPFNDNDISSNMDKIKQNISSNAFIYRVK